MKEILPYVVPLLGLLIGWLLASVARKDAPVEDVKALREELAKKSKLVEDQAKSLKFLNNECNAYRKDCDEALRREALLKTQIKKTRSQAVYWREKYKSVAPEFVDAAHEEEIVTIAKTENEKC